MLATGGDGGGIAGGAGRMSAPGLKPIFMKECFRGLKPPANPAKQATAKARSAAESASIHAGAGLVAGPSASLRMTE